MVLAVIKQRKSCQKSITMNGKSDCINNLNHKHRNTKDLGLHIYVITTAWNQCLPVLLPYDAPPTVLKVHLGQPLLVLWRYL